MIHKVLLILFCLLLSGFVPVNMNSSSLEWQKVELEKVITNKVINILSPIIRSGEFIVNTEITLKTAAELEASGGGGGGEGNGGKGGKKPKIKFSDIDADEAKDDFIILSKVGLAAPVFTEEEGDSSGQAPTGEKSEARDWQQFLIKYMQNADISKSISKITVKVVLDEYLGEETLKTVEKLLSDLNFQFGDIKAEVKLSFLKMKEFKKELDKRDLNKNRELYEWIGKLGAPLGFILAAIVFGIFAYMIFRKYAELQEKQMDLLRNQMSQLKNDQKDEDDDEAKSGGLASTMTPSVGETEDGVERFRVMLKNNPVESCLMVKRWIKEQTRANQMVLNLLSKELSSEELSNIFNQLSIEERKTWKKNIGKNMRPEDVLLAKRYVGAQVVQELILPNTITDPVAVDLLIRINPEESASFAKDEPHLAAILMNVMNARFLSKMMESLEDDTIKKLLEESFQLNNEMMRIMLDEFKSKLSLYVKTVDSSPYLEKLTELIPLCSPGVERTLYNGLHRTGNDKVMMDLARNNFPAELVFKIPPHLLRVLSQSFPREKRPELVLSVSEAFRSTFIEIIAPNEKSRDMLNLELQKFEDDLELKKRVVNNSEFLIKEFVDHCRKQISLNKNYTNELEPLLDEWLLSFKKTGNLSLADGKKAA